MLETARTRRGNWESASANFNTGSRNTSHKTDRFRFTSWPLHPSVEGFWGRSCGAGPRRCGGFYEGSRKDFTANQLHFTLGPENLCLPLATNCRVEKVKDVKLPGFEGEVEWTQHDEGLSVRMPESKPRDHSIARKVIGAWAARRAAARLGGP